MYKSKFTLSDDHEEFEGYTDGSLWNGWANVCFTKTQVKKLLDTWPYDYRFFGRGINEKLIVYIDSSGNETFHSTPLPTDDGRIKRGFFLDGFEFMEVEK